MSVVIKSNDEIAAMQEAGRLNAEVRQILREAIRPGEWKKAKELIAAGTAIDYKGAAGDHNFDEKGDVPGTYALWEVGANGFEVLTEMK